MSENFDLSQYPCGNPWINNYMSLRSSINCARRAKRLMISKSNLFVVGLLQVVLLDPAEGSRGKRTSVVLHRFIRLSGKKRRAEKILVPKILPLHIGHCHSGRWSASKIEKTDARLWYGSPIVVLSSEEE